jgi:hypothetical protein
MCLIFRRSGGDGGRRWRAAPRGAGRAASRTGRRGRGSSRRSSRRCARCGFARSWGEITSCAAICSFDSPRATRRRTSTSRGVSPAGPSCGEARGVRPRSAPRRRRLHQGGAPSPPAPRTLSRKTSEVVSRQQAAEHAVGRVPRTSASWVTMARNARSPRSVMLQRIAFGQVRRRPEGRVAAAPQT